MGRVYLNLILWLAMAGGVAGASPTAERYLEILLRQPDSETAFERLWAHHSGDGTTGELMERVGDLEPAPARFLFARLLARDGRISDAASVYESLREDPEWGRAVEPYLFALYARMPDHDALEFLRATLPEKPDEIWRSMVWNVGLDDLREGRPERAAAGWELMVERFPDDLALRRQLAGEWWRRGFEEKAAAHLEVLTEKGGPEERAWAGLRLAELAERRGDWTGAANRFESLLTITAPGHWLRQEALQGVLQLHGRSGERLDNLERRWLLQARDHPRDFGIREQLLELYRWRNDTGLELAVLREMTELRPGDMNLRQDLARLLVRQGHWEEAVEQADLLLERDPRGFEAVTFRAFLDVQQERLPEAEARLRSWLGDSPGPEEAEQVLAFFRKHHLREAEENLLGHLASEENGVGQWTLEWAGFLHGEYRGEEIERLFRQALREEGARTGGGAAWREVVQFYRGRGESEKAYQWALEFHEGGGGITDEWAALLFDLAMATEAFADAAEWAGWLVENARTEEERREADRRWFLALSGKGTVIEPVEEEPMQPGRGRFPFGFQPSAHLKNPVLEAHQTSLREQAGESGEARDWLRAARWALWMGKLTEAVEMVRPAMETGNLSGADWRFIGELAREGVSANVARELYTTWLEQAPDDGDEVRLHLARLEMQEGEIAAGLEWLEPLRRDAELDIDTALEVAAFLQEGRRAQDALDLLRQLQASVPEHRRGEWMRMLVALYEGQGRSAVAVEEWKAFVLEKEENAALEELIRFAAGRNHLEKLAAELRQAVEEEPQNLFRRQALGKVLFRLGDTQAGFAAVEEAGETRGAEVGLYGEMMTEARRMGFWEEALQYQKRRMAAAREVPTEWWREKAALLEEAFWFGEAEACWDQLLRLSGRDVDTLASAREFYLRRGRIEEAEKLLERLLDIEPHQPEWVLARVRSGADPALAWPDLRRLLQALPSETRVPLPPPPARDDRMTRRAYTRVFQLPGGMHDAFTVRAVRRFWQPDQFAVVASGAAAPPSPRLQVIQTAGQLLRDTAGLESERRAWIKEWWENRDEPEALWALYHAGAGEPTLDLIGEDLEADPDDLDLLQTFLWMGLDLGMFDRLAEGLTNSDGVNRNYRNLLLVAFSQMLSVDAIEDVPVAVDRLFPADLDSVETLQQAAGVLAETGHFHEAVRLQERIWKMSASDQAEHGLELAYWKLMADNPEAAREVLRESLSGLPESPDEASVRVLEHLFRLLDPGERAGFARRLAEVGEGPPMGVKLQEVIVAGLLNDERSARDAAFELLRMRPAPAGADGSMWQAPVSSDYRYWNFVYRLGAKLAELGLPMVAAEVWEEALSDQALIRLQDRGSGTVAGEIELQLAILNIAMTEMGEREELLALMLATDMWRGDRLEILDAYLQASEMGRERAWLHDLLIRQGRSLPDSFAVVRSHYQASGDYTRLLELARFLLRDKEHGLTRRELEEFIGQTAATLQHAGQPVQAEELLRETASSGDHPATALKVRLAALYQSLEFDELALQTLWEAFEERPADPNLLAALGRANLAMEHHAQAAELFAILETEHSRIYPGSSFERLEALFGAGQTEAALGMARRLIRDGDPSAARRVIEILGRASLPGPARDLFCLAYRGVGDTEERIELFQSYLRTVDHARHVDPDDLEMWRMFRELTRRWPAFESGFQELRAEVLPPEILWPLLEDEHREGDPASGLKLAELVSVDDHDRAREVVLEVARSDALAPRHYDLTLAFLEQLQEWATALELADRFRAKDPRQVDYRMDGIRLANVLGETREDDVEILAGLTVFEEELEGPFMELLVETGLHHWRLDEIMERQMQRADREAGERFDRLAQFFVGLGDLDRARQWARRAFEIPGNRDLAWVADFHERAGGEMGLVEFARELGLRGDRLRILRTLEFERGADQEPEEVLRGFYWEPTDWHAPRRLTEAAVAGGFESAALRILYDQFLGMETDSPLLRHATALALADLIDSHEERLKPMVSRDLNLWRLRVGRLAPESWALIRPLAEWFIAQDDEESAGELIGLHLEHSRDPVSRAEAMNLLGQL